jgi:4-hydroxy-tetrahydrodipicolinate synthase
MNPLLHKLRGTGVALVTPFDKNHRVDTDALRKLVKHVIAGKCEYVVALGTTGESVTLTHEEKQLVIDTVVNTVKGKIPIVMGMGGNNTNELIDGIKSYNLKGVDAILSVSPYYNKPSQAGIIAHYKAFAKACPLPVILYNVPGRTGSNMLPETTLELAKEKNIIGIKEAAGSMDQIMDLIQAKPKDFLIISGDDHLALAETAMGADGVISVVANAWPKQFSEMIRLGLKSNFEKARPIHFNLLPVIPLLFKEGNPTGIKYVLEKMNICSSNVRLPLIPVSKPLSAAINKFLQKR